MERSSADQEEGRSREGSRGFFSVCRAWHGSMRRSTGHRPFSPSAASQIDDGDIKRKIDNGRNRIYFLSILFCINILHRVLRSHKFQGSINDRICRLFLDMSCVWMSRRQSCRPVFGSNCRQRAHTVVWEGRNDRFCSIFFTQRSAFIHLTFKLHFCYKAPQPLHKAPFSCTV